MTHKPKPKYQTRPNRAKHVKAFYKGDHPETADTQRMNAQTKVPVVLTSTGDVQSLTPSYCESYTNPNASCPKCGVSVFFYQRQGEGRVFFDELGPPWREHPCLANCDQYYHLWQPEPSPRVKYQWQQQGWRPLFEFRFSQESATIYKLTECGVRTLTTYLKIESPRFPKSAPIFVLSKKVHP